MAPPPPPSPERPAALVRHGGTLVAACFLALGLATLGDYGITWDEPESYRAGAQNLRLIGAALARAGGHSWGGQPLPRWPWHELTGYQFVADSLRAALAAVVNRLFWQPGCYLGFHLVNLLVAAAAVALVARIAAHPGACADVPARAGKTTDAERAGWVLAPLAAALLVLQPKLIAHAQANPKDVVALLVWSAAVLVLARAASSGSLADFALLGVVTGVAMASHASALLLAPLALAWVLLAGGGTLARRSRGLLLSAAVAAPVAVLLWPWLWPAPVARVLSVIGQLRAFTVPMQVLYLGKLDPPSALPWHYGLVSLLIATPLPLLLAALAGLVAAATGGPAARCCRLAALWLALLVLADLAAPARYDGARHLLPALPALALLAAGGVHATAVALWRRGPAGRRGARLLAVVSAASLLAVGVELAAVHPYADAFLDAPARLWLGPHAEQQVELEYWGSSYKEGAEWLRAHAPAGSQVLVPMGPQAAAPFLSGFTLVPHDGSYDATQPQYLLLMTREAWYTPRLRQVVATQHPLFTVRRQDSTLLAVYQVPPLVPPR